MMVLKHTTRTGGLMYIDSDTSLDALVKSYRRAAANLRRFLRDNPASLITKHSETQRARMDNVSDELTRRGLESLRDALRYEHRARHEESAINMRARSRAVKDALGRAKHAAAWRASLMERYEPMREVFEDKRSRKTRPVAEIRAWDRTVRHMPAFESTGTLPDTSRWYSIFLETFDRVVKSERKQFSAELDDLVHEWRTEIARSRGFVPQAWVRQDDHGAVRVGTVLCVRTAGGIKVDVDWGHGDPPLTYSIDKLEPYTEPEPLRMIQAFVSYAKSDGLTHNMEGKEYEDIDAILDDVRYALEEGATHVWIADVYPEGT